MSQLRDASLASAQALPNGMAVVICPPIDLGAIDSPLSSRPRCEILISAPSLNATQLPDGKTMTYEVVFSDNSDFSSPVSYGVFLVQTGAGGAGALAEKASLATPSNVNRYVGLKITASAAGDAAAVYATIEILF